MVAVVVATDLWVTVDMWSAKSLIFSVSAANIATICVNFFDRYMVLNRLLMGGADPTAPLPTLMWIYVVAADCTSMDISGDKMYG